MTRLFSPLVTLYARGVAFAAWLKILHRVRPGQPALRTAWKLSR